MPTLSVRELVELAHAIDCYGRLSDADRFILADAIADAGYDEAAEQLRGCPQAYAYAHLKRFRDYSTEYNYEEKNNYKSHDWAHGDRSFGVDIPIIVFH